MPRKKEEDELIEDKSISVMVYFKGFFLMAIVLIGMFFVNKLGKDTEKRVEPEVKSATTQALASVKDSAESYIQDHVQKEGLYKSLENTSGQVMGEATQAANMVVDTATNTVADFVYEHTLEAVIVTLVEKFPERQKDQFIKRFCEHYTCK